MTRLGAGGAGRPSSAGYGRHRLIPRKDRPAHRRARLSFWRSSARQQIRVHARCRIVQFGQGRLHRRDQRDPRGSGRRVVQAPTATVSKLGDSGTIYVALRMGDGRTVATATTYTRRTAPSASGRPGSWGGPSGTRLPTRFAFFKHRRGSAIPARQSGSAARQPDAGARQSRACVPAVAGAAAPTICRPVRKKKKAALTIDRVWRAWSRGLILSTRTTDNGAADVREFPGIGAGGNAMMIERTSPRPWPRLPWDSRCCCSRASPGPTK